MNLYDDEVDFKSLAEQDSDFASAIQANNGHVDFHNPTIVKQLTISLLKRDFGLRLELPDDRLCPPVPVRYSYVRWIQSLLANSGSSTALVENILLPSTSTPSRSKRIVSGLDIGTGASCIYPLLYISSAYNNQKHRNSHDSIDKEKSAGSVDKGNIRCAAEINITATDTDPYSLKWAKHNIALNSTLISSTGSNIHTVLMKPSDPLLLPIIHSTRSQNEVLGMEPGTDAEAETAIEADTLDFTMCNPPFYSSVEELQQSYTDKSQSPAAVCTGSVSEMVYYDTTLNRNHTYTGKNSPADNSITQKEDHAVHDDNFNVIGGDAAFALRILTESSEPNLRHLVRWYSCMLGKLSSLRIVVERLKAVGVSNWAVCQLRAGNRTKRWAVAWSWGDARLLNTIARDGISNPLLLPASNECTICIDLTSGNLHSLKAIFMIIDRKFKELNMLHWTWNSDTICSHDLRNAKLNNKNDFDGPRTLDVVDETGERNLIINGTGITQGNVWSRSARRRHLLHGRRCRSPSRSEQQGQDKEGDYVKKAHSQPNFNDKDNASAYTSNQSQLQEQHIRQFSPVSSTTDLRFGSQKRKRRREDHDSRSNQEATIDANTRITNDDNDDDGNNNNKDNNNSIINKYNEQNIPRRGEKLSIDPTTLFAFRMSFRTEGSSFSSSPSSPTLKTPPSTLNTATTANATATSTSTSDATSETRTTDKDIYNNNKTNKKSVSTRIHWLYGHDRIVFESFCGMMRRTLQSACNSC